MKAKKYAMGGAAKKRYADGGMVEPYAGQPAPQPVMAQPAAAPKLFVSRPPPPPPPAAPPPPPRLTRSQLQAQRRAAMKALDRRAPDYSQQRRAIQTQYRPQIQAAPRFAAGGVVAANCGASMKPAQKRK